MADDPAPPPETLTLAPVREQEVEFYGDLLMAVEAEDGQVYVPLRPLCTFLGLSWAGARERTLRNPVLAEATRLVRVTRTNSAGGNPTVFCLPLELLPGWLFGISAERVKPALRDKIVRYQRECFTVLWNAFKGDIVPAPPPSGLSGAALALEIAEAVAALARQQVDLEGRYTTMADYMRGHVRQTNTRLIDHEDRLAALELRLDPTAAITEEQAAELALAVKNVGQRLAGRGERNGYAQVYSELYRRYRLSSYKNLPRARYDEVLAWLHGWYAELGAPDDAAGPPA